MTVGVGDADRFAVAARDSIVPDLVHGEVGKWGVVAHSQHADRVKCLSLVVAPLLLPQAKHQREQCFEALHVIGYAVAEGRMHMKGNCLVGDMVVHLVGILCYFEHAVVQAVVVVGDTEDNSVAGNDGEGEKV